MSDLFWPGGHRAGERLSQTSYLAALVRVESAWLDVLGHPADLRSGPALELDGGEVEAGGNPVIPLVEALREQLGGEPGRWLHRGLTSQDVVDSALMLLLRDAVDDVRADLRRQVELLTALVRRHRDTAMAGRTLTQHAVPTTFGLKAATWLTGVLDADDDLRALTFPVQLGGAGGTLAAVVEVGLDPVSAREGLAGRLGLVAAPPWHTARRPVTRVGDALVAATDAWGRLANDVLTLSRPEIGELSEGAGGGSSTMPHKANPVLSVLVRSAALSAPQLAATLHHAAADESDERGAGAWHAEWPALRDLAGRALVAASQTTDLLAGLRVHPERMEATLGAARTDVLAEQRSLAALAGHDPVGDYLGAAGTLVDDVLTRAQEALR
ncbi:MAG: pcaB [Nocardioides sp.]|nr:pcaB [Nocardioides sp.]